VSVLVWLIALVAMVWALYTPARWLIVVPLIITVSWWKKQAYRRVFALTGLALFLGFQAGLPQLVEPTQRDFLWVVDRRETWMQVSTTHGQYYVSLTGEEDYDQGDVLVGKTQVVKLTIATYESQFNFQDYLANRGIVAQLQLEEVETWFRFPLRFQSIRRLRLQSLSPLMKTVVSELLWNRQTEAIEGQQVRFQAWLGLSGLGFFLCLTLHKKILTLLMADHHAHLILMLVWFPWVITNLSQLSILRVYLLFGLTAGWLKHVPNQTIKAIVLIAITVINPYYWMQTGGILYVVYQLYLYLLVPIWSTKAWFNRPASFASFSAGIEWVMSGTITPLRHVLFLPIIFGQIPLFSLWVFYLYTGILMPGLIQMTTMFASGLTWLATVTTPFYLGNMAMVTIMLLFGLGLIVIYLYHLRLRRYQPIVWGLIGMVMLTHLGGVDLYLTTAVYFINVGQGDATLVVSKGRTMLIDTGGQRHFDLAKEVLVPFFKRLRVRQLDKVIITHDDFDHQGALPSLKQLLPIREVITDPFDSFTLGMLTIKNYQHDRHLYQDDNDQSLMIGLIWPTCQILIMGDASVATEARLMTTHPNLQATILRIGHHGSLTSTSSDFLQHVRPKVAIISLGATNRYGHPHQTVLARLKDANIKIRRTDLEGTIHYQTCKI